MNTTNKPNYNNTDLAACIRSEDVKQAWRDMVRDISKGTPVSILIDRNETFGDILCALYAQDTKVETFFNKTSNVREMLTTNPLTIEIDGVVITMDRKRWVDASMGGNTYTFEAEDVPIIFAKMDEYAYICNERTKQSILEILSFCNLGCDAELNKNSWLMLAETKAHFSEFVKLAKHVLVDYRIGIGAEFNMQAALNGGLGTPLPKSEERKEVKTSPDGYTPILAEHLSLIRWTCFARVASMVDMLGLSMAIVLGNPTAENLDTLRKVITGPEVKEVTFTDLRIELDTTVGPIEKRVLYFWEDLKSLIVPRDIRESIVRAHGIDVDLAPLKLDEENTMLLQELCCKVKTFLGETAGKDYNQ